MLSLQHLPKVLIAMSGFQNLAINLQALIGSISLHQTTATASMSILNLISKGNPTIKQHIFYRWKRYNRKSTIEWVIIHMVAGYHVVNSVIYKSHAAMQDYNL